LALGRKRYDHVIIIRWHYTRKTLPRQMRLSKKRASLWAMY
jgi:hypothetical protein